ncbi:putative CASP-like protein PIMP1-like [Capsicum annuum]|uniref:Leucine-rich repeat-containing N-terminal plant-type domain-containing protein n=1 Tax=Capsicum annuum TaxID=4072 RepID=A0A2G2ZKJ4_CAPAN|nr:putative CASP-like protein PIMP1-like [Capsicum annuum]KAF3639490.1 putative CASP-like protein PIMP1-like [Capsicum annuum]PHT82506.1 hypothetical protein T459_15521 [Capsicum annuum]
MSFKSLLTDPSNRLASWKGENCCSWKGIECLSSGRVVVVNLRNPHPDEVMISINNQVISNSNNAFDFALKGAISPLLFSLDHIQHLDLSFNNFVFSKLPVEISNLTKLTYLNLSNAMFQDSIDMQFSNLTSLRSLDLSCANLVPDFSYVFVSTTLQPKPTSCIHVQFDKPSILISDPEWFTRVYSYFDLSNPLTRVPEYRMVPWCILQLPKLLYLSVNKNNLNGNVPLSLLQKSRLDLTSIVILILVNKSLSGAILYWLFNLPALSALDLPMNNFEGVIPPTIQMKSSLFPSIVNLARKKLQGHIPTQLENVNVIDLSLNNFVGSIPAQMGEIPAIRSIALSGNKIHGPIPESFCQSINVLQVLDLSNNSFSGIIPRSLGSCKSLIYLSLGQNKLTGSVPEELERVTSLRCLDLNGNEFEGSFPTVIEKFQELEILNLAGNRFKGRIPKFIGDLNHLRILVLASSSFNESIPEGVMKLENLQLLVCPGTNCPVRFLRSMKD